MQSPQVNSGKFPKVMTYRPEGGTAARNGCPRLPLSLAQPRVLLAAHACDLAQPEKRGRGRLTALAPSRTLLEGFDKGSRAVLATASRGSRDGLAGQGWPIGSARKAMRSRMIQRR